MKKRILFISLSLILLYFPSTIYYNVLIESYKQEERVLDSIINRDNIRTEYVEQFDVQGNQVSDVHIAELEKLELAAGSAVLMDGDNCRVLYEKNGYKEVAMASTTKIMTCIIALENGNLNDVVTVSKYASTMPDVQLKIKEGEQYILRDLLYSLMLESHNDVAVAIAEHVGGSVEGFAKLMNTKAKELGCEHTNFVTPNGLDADGHQTTAVELAKIASYAIKNKDFLAITNSPNWTFKELKTQRGFMVSNKDKFLYMYDGAIGVKTGFTNKAGYCFVGAVKKDGKTFVSAVLASGWPPHKNYKWRDTTKLMDFGMNNFEKREIFREDKKFNPIYVENGKEKLANIYYDGEISLLMHPNEVVKVVYHLPEKLQAPVEAESVVGKASYYVGDMLIDEVPILTANSVETIDFEFCLQEIIDLWSNKLNNK